MSRTRDCPSPNRFLLFMFALLACPFAARALDLDLKLEPGAALSLNGQKSNVFACARAATRKGLVGFEGGYVNLAAGVTFLGLPAQTAYIQTSVVTAWAP